MRSFAWWSFALAATTACYPEFSFDEPTGQGGAPGTSSRASVGSRGAGGDGSGANGVGGEEPGTTTSGPTSSTTGVGGAGGAGGATWAGPQVSCGPADGMGDLHPCQVDEVCCFHKQDPDLDLCTPTSSCGSTFFTFACDGPEDCPGSICCGAVGEDFFGEYFEETIACKSTCAAPNRRMCHTAADCEGAETCEPLLDFPLFTSGFAPEYEPYYRVCTP